LLDRRDIGCPPRPSRRQASWLINTSDGQGFFGYNPGVGAYIEIIDFDKLVQDAKRRNRILFDKLGIPETI
jgi:hypothetical protein